MRGVKIKKADEVSSADGCDGLGGFCSHNPVAENLSYNKIYFIKLIAKEMSFMLNLGIDGKEAVKIKKKVRHKSVAHPFM